MVKQIPSVFNWSGGKDSTLALHHVLKQKLYDVRYLLTTVNSSFNHIAMHGVREDLLIEQANSLNLPLFQVHLPEMPDMGMYEKTMSEALFKIKAEGVTHSIFGDIFLEDLKVYRENQLAKIGMEAVFPLWKRDSLTIVKEFINLGYKTIVVCAQEDLKDFCGRVIDQSFLNDLPNHIDPCGENGEFHTFVFDGPIFNQPINFEIGELVYKTFSSPNASNKSSGFWYIDLIPRA
ncbi:Dph6-related ATP pyrophosphatase [Pedobacter boryungensis]|uniref:Diphthine--ammonia ligase n=1 Tax=Pedobacter boryungensis TaxID=869962 RepID=A0ABX2DD04_9SPHI|nr:diphthine--ammonia ligase [Pedobacter boryungensis]NQX30866.1 diphthine--ammonia ligase [Pedobacter boryungensis]